MPNRLIHESCRLSETLALLSDFAERLFWRLTTVADDFGRFNAKPMAVRAACFPMMLDRVTDERVAQALAELAEVGTVTFYQVGDKTIGEFSAWMIYQQCRSKRSKFPARDHPQASASNCQQTKTDSNTNTFSNTNISDLSSQQKDQDQDQDLPAVNADQLPDGDHIAVAVIPTSKKIGPLQAWFETEFVPAYPEHRQVQHKTALRVLKELRPNEIARAGILETLAFWVESDDWTRDGGAYVPGMGKFFSDSWYQRRPSARASPPHLTKANQELKRMYQEAEQREWASERNGTGENPGKGQGHLVAAEYRRHRES